MARFIKKRTVYGRYFSEISKKKAKIKSQNHWLFFFNLMSGNNEI